MFEQFIREQQYLKGVSPRTIQWYRESFKWRGSPNADLKDFVIGMRQKGLKPGSCNNRIRAVNAYLRWLITQKADDSKPHLCWYVLDENNKVVRTKCMYEADAFLSNPRRIVKQETVADKYRVSTVFLGLNHEYWFATPESVAFANSPADGLE